MPKKKKSSTPAWELAETRNHAKAMSNLKNGVTPDVEQIKPLLKSYMGNPSCMNHQKETELDYLLVQVTYLPDTHPVKQELIEFTEEDRFGKSIANYLQNPKMVGVLR